jgi:hypothetical protein
MPERRESFFELIPFFDSVDPCDVVKYFFRKAANPLGVPPLRFRREGLRQIFP